MVLACLAVVIPFINCGNKGSLYMAQEVLPLAVEDLQVHQIGNQIHLQWRFPQNLSDGKTSFDPNRIKYLTIHYANEKYPAENFRRKSDVLHKLKYGQISIRQNRSTFAMTFSNRDLAQKSHYFAVLYRYGRKRSPLSKIVSLDSQLPPQAIRDLQVSHEGKVVKLKWSRVTQDITANNLTKILGYKIFRKIEGQERSDFTLEFSQINKQRILKEYFEDRDTGTNGTYTYQVSTVIAENIESFPSNQIRIKVTDLFPPEIPANLVSFRAKDHIYLSWAKVKDLDLSHYKIYRRTGEGEFKVIVDSIKTNFYTDRDVNKGMTYHYYVTSVDQKANESNRSNISRTNY
jgi:hypothetical protein